MRLLKRRRFVASMGLGAGAWLLSPMLRQLIRPAMGQASSKKRVLFFIDRIGIHDELRPTGSETSLELGAYAPLAPCKDKTLVVQHMYNPFGHHLHGNHWPLTAMDRKQLDGVKTAPLGPSIDRVIAQKMGTDAPISSLNLAVWPDSDAGTYSADGPSAPFAVEIDPVRAFASIFGKTTPADPADNQDAAKALLRQKKSVLDFMVADIAKAGDGLGAPERAKLEQYLASIREIETKLEETTRTQLSCTSPVPPDPAALSGKKFENEKRPTAVIDLMVQALSCGFSRVGVIANNSKAHPFLGQWIDGGGKPNYPGAHGMWHGGGTETHRRAYYGYTAKNLAHLRQRLESMPDGNETLGETTLIVFMNNSGGRHHGGQNDYVFMTIGDLKGRLRTGRLVQLPKSKVTAGDPRITMVTPGDSGFKPKVNTEVPVHSVADFFVTVARAVGAEIDSFGDPRINKGSLEGVFA